jgi:hypothetical protein
VAVECFLVMQVMLQLPESISKKKMLKNKNIAKEASCAGPSRTEEIINSF